jgi:iron complex transport system substrate-binding protein
VALPGPAARVVSLVPSGTDLLLAMGAGDRLVGRTDHDDAAEVAALPSVGGLEPSLEALVSLRPELVVVWHAAAAPVLRERLEAQGIRTFALGTRDTAQTFAAVAALGRLVGRGARAGALAESMRRELAAVEALPEPDTPTVLFVVNVDPPMTAGPGTFMAQLAGVAGARPAFPELAGDWAPISPEAMVRRQPEWLVLSGGAGAGSRERGMARLRASPGWRELRAVRDGRVVAVPEALLSRPGPRLGEAARLLREAIHGACPPGR